MLRPPSTHANLASDIEFLKALYVGVEMPSGEKKV
jgi:hypothetical protein